MEMLTNCVNPYEVNPIMDRKNSCQQKLPKNIKVEMEEFRDLEPYLSDSTPLNSIDELNTPIFDKEGQFDFTLTENSAAFIEDPFKFERNNLAFKTINNSTTSNYNKHQNNVLLDQENIEVVNMQNSSSESSPNEFIIETPNTVQSEDQTSVAFNCEDCSVLSEQHSNASSPCDDHIHYLNKVSTSTNETYSNLSSPNDTYVIEDHNLGIETPDDSNSSDNVSVTMTKPSLLNIGLNQTSNVLSTPDVIDTVVSLDETFNILDFVNAKDLASVKLEDIPFELPSTSEETSLKVPKRKRGPKRRYSEDDEDYIPPSLKKSSSISSDSDYDGNDNDYNYNYIMKKKSKRGRPSLYSNKVSDFSNIGKYRELRDKNNEASRRSRLKRKVKEQSLEEEANQLQQKNIKLKAQVSELERMVNNFRNNLFKIMLKK